MPQELLWLGMIVVSLAGPILFYRMFGRIGLFAWIALAIPVANIQVTRLVTLFGLQATLGNALYGSTFLCTDILSENYGKDNARMGVRVGLGALIASTVLLQLVLAFAPGEGDLTAGAFSQIFGLVPRIAAGSLAAYLVSQIHDIWAYHAWKARVPRALWLRNLASTTVSQLIDSAVFVAVAFAGVFPLPLLLEIMLTTFLFKLVVAVADTPVLYLAKNSFQKGRIPEPDRFRV